MESEAMLRESTGNLWPTSVRKSFRVSVKNILIVVSRVETARRRASGVYARDRISSASFNHRVSVRWSRGDVRRVPGMGS